MKQNLKRTFSGRRGWFLIGLSVVLTVIQLMTFNRTNYLYDPSLYLRIFPLDRTGYGVDLYSFLFPLIAAFYGGSFYAQDRQWNLQAFILGRMSRGSYYKRLYQSAFLAGGLAGIAPLGVHWGLFALGYPLRTVDTIQSQINIVPETPEGFLFWLNHPLLTMGLFALVVFLAGGAWALAALAVSYWVETPYFETLAPLLLAVFGMLLTELLGWPDLSPLNLTRLSSLLEMNLRALLFLALEFLGLVFLTGVIHRQELVGRWDA